MNDFNVLDEEKYKKFLNTDERITKLEATIKELQNEIKKLKEFIDPNSPITSEYISSK